MLTFVLIILCGALAVGMWFAVLGFLSQLSGWNKLASLYPGRQPASGKCFLMQGGKVGAVYYTGCLMIHTSAEAIRISVWPIFRFQHPPLFIPWRELHNPRERRLFCARLEELDIGSPAVGTIQLLPSVLGQWEELTKR
jgi:hypothetical protein